MENARKILHQIPEIHPAVSRKIKQHLTFIKGVFRIHHLHVELVLSRLLTADTQRFLLLAPEHVDLLFILRRRLPVQRPQRLLDKFFIHHLHTGGNDPVLQSLRGFRDHMVSHLQFQAVRIKIINLTRTPESHTDNPNHKTKSLILISQPPDHIRPESIATRRASSAAHYKLLSAGFPASRLTCQPHIKLHADAAMHCPQRSPAYAHGKTHPFRKNNPSASNTPTTHYRSG